MAKSTTNINLILPEKTDNTIVRDIYNTNWNTIDDKFSPDVGNVTKTGAFTAGKIVKINNASGIIEMASNTDAEVADAVTKKHSQNTDTALATLTAGIPFPATQVPSENANTLDDYEEGTWTPDLQFGGLKVGITYTARSGSYTKIGRFVMGFFSITLSNKGTSVGGATINSLPFSAGGLGGICHILYHAAITVGAWENRIDGGTAAIQLCKINTNTIAALVNTDFANNTIIIGSFFYNV